MFGEESISVATVDVMMVMVVVTITMTVIIIAMTAVAVMFANELCDMFCEVIRFAISAMMKLFIMVVLMVSVVLDEVAHSSTYFKVAMTTMAAVTVASGAAVGTMSTVEVMATVGTMSTVEVMAAV